MGCLNSEGKFEHWFGNIHLSGPCNRRCYFCIGQHMMKLDSFNSLDEWPLPNLDKFIYTCRARDITEVNVTGTNTDPLLYKHTPKLTAYLREMIPGCTVGVRTNGARVVENQAAWDCYDKASVTICSFDPEIHKQMMGLGEPPDLGEILLLSEHMSDVKINVVLGPENRKNSDLFKTIGLCSSLGVKRINLREPYGQPRVGNPFQGMVAKYTLGMPTYVVFGVEVTYWEVHFVEVESVNLYANGRVSEDYPITRGYHPTGEVKPQDQFPGGRIQEQWISWRKR